MIVRFGVWDHLERRPTIPVEEQYQQKIQLLRDAERLGFYGYHLAEHHLSPLDLAPSPNVFLAALAQATERLRIGSMVYILPLYHPVRLVQEICMLDQLSGGRLDVGIGRGIRAVEHEWFGLAAEEARARSEETLRILVSALSTGNLAYRGRYYQIGDAKLDLLPRQRPYPPLWYAGGVEFAGRYHLNFVGRTPADLARYWALADESSDRDDVLHAHLPIRLAGLTKHVVVRERMNEAMEVARRAWPVFQRNWTATSLRLPDGRVARGNEDFDAVLRENMRLLIGTPATIREYLEAAVAHVQERTTFYFAPAVQWGDITLDESRETLRLLAEQVMPSFTVFGGARNVAVAETR